MKVSLFYSLTAMLTLNNFLLTCLIVYIVEIVTYGTDNHHNSPSYFLSVIATYLVAFFQTIGVHFAYFLDTIYYYLANMWHIIQQWFVYIIEIIPIWIQTICDAITSLRLFDAAERLITPICMIFSSPYEIVGGYIKYVHAYMNTDNELTYIIGFLLLLFIAVTYYSYIMKSLDYIFGRRR